MPRNKELFLPVSPRSSSRSTVLILFQGQNTALHNQKRKLELELQMIANEVDESFDEAKLSIQKSKKAHYECASLGEDYRKACDHTEFISKLKLSLDMEIKHLTNR